MHLDPLVTTPFLIIPSGAISEDVFEEVAQHGEIENLNVCDNIADHMVGPAGCL